MIKKTTKNVELSFESLQEIYTTKTKLNNLEKEIVSGRSVLTTLNLEIDQKVKDRKYQDDLLVEVTGKVAEKQKELDILIPQVEKSKITIVDNTQKSSEVGLLNDKRKTQLDIRENYILNREKGHEKKIEDFNTKNDQLVQERLIVDTAKEKFLQAIEAVTWK